MSHDDKKSIFLKDYIPDMILYNQQAFTNTLSIFKMYYFPTTKDFCTYEKGKNIEKFISLLFRFDEDFDKRNIYFKEKTILEFIIILGFYNEFENFIKSLYLEIKNNDEHKIICNNRDIKKYEKNVLDELYDTKIFLKITKFIINKIGFNVKRKDLNKKLEIYKFFNNEINTDIKSDEELVPIIRKITLQISELVYYSICTVDPATVIVIMRHYLLSLIKSNSKILEDNININGRTDIENEKYIIRSFKLDTNVEGSTIILPQDLNIYNKIFSKIGYKKDNYNKDDYNKEISSIIFSNKEINDDDYVIIDYMKTIIFFYESYSFNKITEIPKLIFKMINLKTLSLNKDKLEYISESIGDLINLEKLDLSNNNIEEIPESIGKLKKLKELILLKNNLEYIPDSIGELKNLEILDLSSNNISSLPESIGDLISLKKLDLSHNKIESIPDTINKLINLEYLSLSYNEISNIPKSIVSLNRLQSLFLSNNKIYIIPESIGDLIHTGNYHFKKRIEQKIPDNKNINDEKPLEIILSNQKLQSGGLILDNKIISSISGPVSINILKPSMKFHKEFKAPIFILFGDIHFSRENICTDCTCKTDVEKSCCYEVYSNDFLKLIDKIASDPKYPVDFSIEAGLHSVSLESLDKDSSYANVRAFVDSSILEANVQNTPMKLLRERIFTCYLRNVKEKKLEYYKNNCPTINIRWQLADTRQVNVKEGFNYKYNFGKFMHDIMFFFHFIYNTDVITRENFKEFLKNRFDNIKHFINKTEYHEALKHIFDKDYYKYIDKDTSLVFKQLKKLPKEEQKIWEKWIEEYYKYLHEIYIKRQPILLNIDFLKNKYDDYIEYLIEFLEIYYGNHPHISAEDIFKEYLIMIKDISKQLAMLIFLRFIEITSGDLDLYFILRSFKKPEGSNNPLISIGYFGADHCRFISYFLKNIIGKDIEGAYEEVYKNDIEKSNNRCLKIEKLINLDEIIDSYKK